MIPLTPRSVSGTIDAAGEAVLVFGPVRVGHRWEVQRITVSGSAPAEARVYAGGRLVAGTYSGQLDTAEAGGSPAIVREGEQLEVRFSAGTAGASCSASLEGQAIPERL